MKNNSTKGKSLINPTSYKGDVLTQVWLDSRVLATLSNWLDGQENGLKTRFLSEVVKYSLTSLADFLVDNNEVELVDDTIYARSLLEFKYKVNLNPKGKGKRNIQHNMLLSDKRKKLKASNQFLTPDIDKPMNDSSPDSRIEMIEEELKRARKESAKVNRVEQEKQLRMLEVNVDKDSGEELVKLLEKKPDTPTITEVLEEMAERAKIEAEEEEKEKKERKEKRERRKKKACNSDTPKPLTDEELEEKEGERERKFQEEKKEMNKMMLLSGKDLEVKE